MSLEYWFMLPISVGIATVAMASGVEGATFFSPLFILGLGLPPEVAIGTGLITEVFGFASGLLAYVRKRLIDYRLGFNLLMATIPMALLGTWLAGFIEADILKVILGIGLVAVALSFLRSPDHRQVRIADAAIQQDFGADPETCLTTREGERICYTVCNRTEGRLISGVGGLFIGMVSTGLGELNGFFLLQRCRVPSAVSVATSVLVVSLTALAASTGHVIKFVQGDPTTLATVLNLTLFTVPGVLIGGQLGPLVARYLPQKVMERGLGILFVLVAGLVLAEVMF